VARWQDCRAKLLAAIETPSEWSRGYQCYMVKAVKAVKKTEQGWLVEAHAYLVSIVCLESSGVKTDIW
jgi:hypothetical protein